MAPESIPGGSSYAAEIPAAIRNCGVFLLVLSSLCQTSKWVPRELDQAINDNKVIMPFMIEDCPLRDDFKFYLTNVQRYEAYRSREKAAEKLVRDIKALLISGEKEYNSQEAIPAAAEPEHETGVNPEIKKAPEKSAAPKTHSKSSGSKRLLKWLIPSGAVLAACIIGAFVIYSSSVTKINGKSYRRNMRDLELTDAVIDQDDIAGIAKLEALETLTLKNCTIKANDLSGISLNSLRTLTISGCGLSDAQLSSIDFSKTQVRYLNLSDNTQLTELDGIKPLADTLAFLSIDGNAVSDISALSGFADLNELNADSNAISDISVLAECTDLYSLSLSSNSISDITALSSCAELQQVYLNGNSLTSLSGLESSLSLRHLEADSNQITSIDGLCNATILEEVFLCDNKLDDVSLLSKSAGTIRRLYLSDNKLKSDSFLTGMTALEYLAVDRNELSGLSCLADSRKLISLTASGNDIGTTAGFEGLEGLKYLNLADCDISVIGYEQPLTFSDSDGAVLDLSGNSVTEPNIDYDGRFALLSFKDTKISDTDFISSASASKLIIDYDNFVYPSLLMLGDYVNYVILDCPPDQQLYISDALGGAFTSFEESGSFSYDIRDYLPDISFGNAD